MSSTLAVPVAALAPPTSPDGVDAAILAAVHQDAIAAEHGAVSRAKLKHSASLFESIEHLQRICAPDMKACFDHPDRPGSTMMLRRQEAWQAIGDYLCILLGLVGMEIKVRALDYFGHYEVVLVDKDPVDGLREVIKTAKRHGVFVAREVERMYADKQRGGMMFGTYRNDAVAANDADAADNAANRAPEADASSPPDDGQAPTAAETQPAPDAAAEDAAPAVAVQAVAAMPDQAPVLTAIDPPAPAGEAVDVPALPPAPMAQSAPSTPAVRVKKTRVARPLRTAQGAVVAPASASVNVPEQGEASRTDQSHGAGTLAVSRQLSRHRDIGMDAGESHGSGRCAPLRPILRFREVGTAPANLPVPGH